MKIQDFLNVEQKLAAGTVDNISLGQDSHLIAGYFLRAMRGRGDLSEVVHSAAGPSFVDVLEKIRSELRKNNLDEAWKQIEFALPQDDLEKIELGLEISRYHLFAKNYEALLAVSDPILLHPRLAAPSKMTFLQIRGLALVHLKRFDQAIRELEMALTMASLFPRANSGFVALTVLAQAHAEKGDLANSQKILIRAQDTLNTITDSDEWAEKKVQHLRAQYHFARNFGQLDECAMLLSEAQTLACWLGLKRTEKMCREDLLKYKLEFDSRVAMAFSTWSYLPRLKLALVGTPKRIERFENSEVLSQMIEALSVRPLPLAELFERIWKIPYREGHANHLRAILSKLRARLPKQAVKVRDKIVSLN